MAKALYRMRVRLALICVLTTGILLCVMAAVLLWISEAQMDVQREASFKNSANSIIYRLQTSRVIDDLWLSQIESGDSLIIHIEDNASPILFRGSWAPRTDRGALVDSAHEKALSDYGFDAKKRPRSVIDTENLTFELQGSRGERYLASITLIPSDIGWQSLTLLKDLDSDMTRKLMLRASFFAVIFVSLILLLMFSLAFSRRAASHIETANRKQVEFIAAASHELRAPLSIVKASLHDGQTVANREINRMSRLIDEMLLLASADTSKLAVASGNVDIDTVLTELYESFELIAKNKNQRLRLTLPDYALPIIRGDKQRISQALTAILDNAVSYTPENGNISIEAKKSRRAVIITVTDDGPGVPDSEKPKIFDRFYRSDTSRADKEHYGLGLSVAKEIIELHGGKISVADSQAGGASFTVILAAGA